MLVFDQQQLRYCFTLRYAVEMLALMPLLAPMTRVALCYAAVSATRWMRYFRRLSPYRHGPPTPYVFRAALLMRFHAC